ncbi:MAG: 3-oxoacyl-ACP synthase, partial [Bacteroidetes bacterium]|nr:3-oxoacyl-ACP synthase [Bacteroidota bacterium]
MTSIQHPASVKIIGSGSFLPGEAILPDQVDYYLGQLTEAPEKIRKWLQRVRILMKELLEVEYYHFALDPKTREFTEDNVSMSVKAAREAITDAGMK